MASLNSIATISNENCCGCRTCEQLCPVHCISMKRDQEGFLYPHVDNSICINCGLCLKKCPSLVQTKNKPIRIWAAKSKDRHIQYISSSGGAFGTIARYAVTLGYIIYGASYTQGFSYVQHESASSISSLIRFKGSKYVQSDTLRTYSEVKELLESGKKVLYSGVGCQIQGLKNFLRKDYDNLLTIDLLCHGVSSPSVFSDYINYITERYGEIEALNMKDKYNGWGKQTLKFILKNKSNSVPVKISNLWNKLYYSNVILRPSCYHCKFTEMNRCGDITLGDYWGVEKFYPDFYDSNGISLIFMNTIKGIRLIDDIEESMHHISISQDECEQPVLQGPTNKPSWRKDFWGTYSSLGFKEVVYKYWEIILGNKILLKINRIFNKEIFK